MKNGTQRFRAVDKKNFAEVKNGSKSVETRAGTVRYRPIAAGDTLTFVCGKEKFTKKILKKFHWPSVDAMTKQIGFKKIMPSVSSIAEMKKAYASYPDYEKKTKEFGLLGFELE
jgi:ASC-1-like (ASCH) protein